MKRPIGLVEYGSSEEEDHDAKQRPKPQPKKRKLPPLSSTVTVPVPLDDPALHQGRKRTVPHVDGQYASFLREVFSTAKAVVPALHSIGICDTTDERSNDPELRISLTRPIYLRAHQREEFRVALRAIAKRFEQFVASFVQFTELVNDERTRTFLTLEIGAGHRELKALSDALIPILNTFHQELFYNEPRFHASIAWALLSEPETTLQQDTAPETIAAQNQTPEVHCPVSPKKAGPDPVIANTNAFPAIPRMPPKLLQALQQQHGSALLSKHVGVFDADEMCLRIGKDVTRWRLGKD